MSKAQQATQTPTAGPATRRRNRTIGAVAVALAVMVGAVAGYVVYQAQEDPFARGRAADTARLQAQADAYFEAQAAGQPSERLTAYPAGTSDAPLGYYEYVPPGYGDDGPAPLLVFLHGYGGNGDGSPAELDNLFETGIPELIQSDQWSAERPFVVLAPQHAFPQDVEHYAPCEQAGTEFGASCANWVQHEQGHPADGSSCTTPAEIHDFIAYATATYDVDPDRVYLTGLSCGGFAAYEYVAEFGASQIAAMVAIAGEGRPAWDSAGCALGDVPIWAFHGDADDLVDPNGSSEPLANLAGCPSATEAELTIYPGVDHDSWSRTYDLTADHDIYEWLLSFSRP